MYNLLLLGMNLLAVEGSVTDEGLNEVLQQILGIVNDTLLPIIWAALGMFLVIKGALVGTQIVKAADEPQVRQEKINSLKYLIIGVAIAFGVSFVAMALINFFQDFAG